MSRLVRLLRYVRPYALQLLASVVLMALVGLFDAFRVLLVGPVLDRVLNPTVHPAGIPLIPRTIWGHQLSLQLFVPSSIHNDWSVVAFALVVSTVLKGIC